MIIIVQLVMYLAITIRFDVMNTTVVLFAANAIVIYSDHLYNENGYSVKNSSFIMHDIHLYTQKLTYLAREGATKHHVIEDVDVLKLILEW